MPSIYLQEDRGDLSFLATPTTLGTYMCQATENGFTQTLAVYEVQEKVDSTLQSSSSTSPTHSPETGRDDGATTLSKIETIPVTQEKKPATPKPTVSTETETDPSPTHAPADGSTDRQKLETGACYLKELVAVSVLLVMCVCALLLVTAYVWRKSYRSRTAPHLPSTEGGTDQEREALRGSSSQLDKYNEQKSPNTPSNGVSNGSNGHLPNIPI